MKQAKKLESLKSNVFTSTSSVLGGGLCVPGYAVSRLRSLENKKVGKGVKNYTIDTFTSNP